MAFTARNSPLLMSSSKAPATRPVSPRAGRSATARVSSKTSVSRRTSCSATRLVISMPSGRPCAPFCQNSGPRRPFGGWCRPRCDRKSSRTPFSRRSTQPGARLTSAQASSWSFIHAPPFRVSRKVVFHRVALGEGDVVAALHHARAAALAEEALYRDGYVEGGVALVCGECGEQARTARTQNENVPFSSCARGRFSR